jgi:hypothetical protein
MSVRDGSKRTKTSGGVFRQNIKYQRGSGCGDVSTVCVLPRRRGS